MVNCDFFLFLEFLQCGVEFFLTELAAKVKALYDGPLAIFASHWETEIEALRNSV